MNNELINKIKGFTGTELDRNNIEFCQVYDDEWQEIIDLCQQPQWISVKDRLPPRDGTHFIIHKQKYTRQDRRDGYTYTAVVFYRKQDDIRPDYIGDPDECEETDYIIVERLLTAWSHKYLPESFTHWQPLPSPPEQ